MKQLRAAATAAALVLAAVPAANTQDYEDPAAQPSWIAPLAARSLLIDLARAGDRIVAVGERGHVLYSTDQGVSWTQVQVPTSANLTAVYFADDRRGWAVGHGEVILRTEDGGDTWDMTHFAPENGQPLLDVWFGDGEQGLAVGAYGSMYSSSDGGRSWDPVPFEPDELGAGADDAPAGEDEYADEIDVGFDFHLNAIAPGPGARLYLAGEAGRLYRSDDAGQTWRELPSEYDGSFYGILPLDGDSLLVFGLRGHMFRSEDGGESWTRIETGTVALLNSATRAADGRVIVAGNTGVLLVSHDDGRTFEFTQQDDRKSLSAVLAVDSDEVIVAGEGGVRRLAVPGSR